MTIDDDIAGLGIAGFGIDEIHCWRTRDGWHCDLLVKGRRRKISADARSVHMALSQALAHVAALARALREEAISSPATPTLTLAEARLKFGLPTRPPGTPNRAVFTHAPEVSGMVVTLGREEDGER